MEMAYRIRSSSGEDGVGIARIRVQPPAGFPARRGLRFIRAGERYMRVGKLLVAGAVVWASMLALVVHANTDGDDNIDARLARVLRQHGFTGRIESTLEERLGRRIDDDLANLGRLLWFDPAHALHRDNTCAGCHSPTNGFGDTQ